jgi:hypothetical protein
MTRIRSARTLWNILIVSSAGIGVLILVIHLVPYQAMKTWVDLLAPDGSMESFRPAIFSQFKRIFFPIGLASFLVTAWLFSNRHRSERILSNSYATQKIFIAARVDEIRQLSGELRRAIVDSRYGIALLVIVALGIGYRAVLLSKQVSHDEAYTFMAFVSWGLQQVLTDYHLPNNHVFHSVMVFFSTEIFGIQPWAIRFPAFIAGIVLIPATYLLARCFYDKQTALISAGWVASIPVLISYATNARGYSLISLFTLLLVALGFYLKEKKNLVGWSAFVLLASLGFYTIPVMLYPFGLIVTWLVLAALFKQVGPDYGDNPFFGMLIRCLVPVCIAIFLLVLLLYSPIFLSSGIQSVIGNGFVSPLEWPVFLETIPVRITNTWREWNAGLPPVGSILMVTGIGASILTAVAGRPFRIPLVIPAILWIGSVLVVQRVAPWPRVWIFLLPLVLISSAAGLVVIARALTSRLPAGGFLFNVLFAAYLVVPLGAKAVDAFVIYKQSEGQHGNVEEVALFLKSYLEPDDVILVTSPDGVTTRYYLTQYGVQGNYSIGKGDGEFRRALAIVNRHHGQSLDYVLEERASKVNFDTGSARIVYQEEDLLVYELAVPPGSGD